MLPLYIIEYIHHEGQQTVNKIKHYELNGKMAAKEGTTVETGGN
jgi:hypothetical protein